ncbi:MAG: hypothetical protein M3341_12280, partial [Actinomycetota bacterium]|nr:hypothetical protein [Actinomycetota bacterium]
PLPGPPKKSAMFGSSSSTTLALEPAHQAGVPLAEDAVVATDPASVDADHVNGGATVQSSS